MSTKTKSDSPTTAPVKPAPAPVLPPAAEPIPAPAQPIVEAIAPAPQPPPPAPPPPPPVQQPPPPDLPAAPKVHFAKEVLSSAFIVGGRKPAWEPLDLNQGVIALDPSNPQEAELIEGLNEAAGKHIGGVLRISADEYAKKKQRHPFIAKPPPGSDPLLRTIPTGPAKAKPSSSPSTAAAAPPANPKELEDADVQAPPDRPDYEKFIPKTARIGGEKATAVIGDV